jgi:hypothetical protein
MTDDAPTRPATGCGAGDATGHLPGPPVDSAASRVLDGGPIGHGTLQAARDAVASRLATFPRHPLFALAAHELDGIENAIRSGRPIDARFYRQPGTGQMCVSELEASDPGFCDLVYDLLEEIRKEAGQP